MRRAGPNGVLVAAALLLACSIMGLRHLPADPPLSVLEDRLVDLRFALRGPRPAPVDVLIIGIDEASVESIGMMAPMRSAVAEALILLTDAGAAAIVIDLLLIEETSADAQLVAALAASPGAILAVAASDGTPQEAADLPLAALRQSAFSAVARVTSDTRGRQAELSRRPTSGRQMSEDNLSGPGISATGAAVPTVVLAPLLLPTAHLAGASRLGHVNIGLSTDRVVRSIPLAIPFAEYDWLPAAPLVAARAVLGIGSGDMVLWPGKRVDLGPIPIRTDAAGAVILNHYGGRASIETQSLLALLEGGVDPAKISGRAVFIGPTAESLRDIFATPFAPDVAGVEILATLAGNVIDGTLVRNDGALVRITAAVVVIGVLLAAIAALASSVPLFATIATAGVWGLGWAAIQILFNAGLALDAVTILGSLLSASVLFWMARLRREQFSARSLAAERGVLASFLSPFAAATLTAGGSTSEPRTEEATIAFVDIVGFVSMTDGHSPAGTAALMADTQARISQAATRHGGAVVERTGDGALVAFGFGTGGGALEALSFARDLAQDDGQSPLLRISMQTGQVAMAQVGTGGRSHVTVAGDTVNVAARLQDTAKRNGANVVVGRAVLDAAGVKVGSPGAVEADTEASAWQATDVSSSGCKVSAGARKASGMSVTDDQSRGAAESCRLRPLGQQAIRGKRTKVDVWAVLPN